jgi:hypothetical protein
MSETKTLTKVELERQLNAEANRVVMFINFSDEPFSGLPYIGKDGKEHVDEHCKWDNMPETFAAGSVSYLPQFKFLRFSKHLVDRELNKAKLPTNHFSRGEYLKKCSAPVSEEQKIMEEKMAKEEFAAGNGPVNSEIAPRKPGRPKKVMEEDAFVGK